MNWKDGTGLQDNAAHTVGWLGESDFLRTPGGWRSRRQHRSAPWKEGPLPVTNRVPADPLGDTMREEALSPRPAPQGPQQ